MRQRVSWKSGSTIAQSLMGWIKAAIATPITATMTIKPFTVGRGRFKIKAPEVGEGPAGRRNVGRVAEGASCLPRCRHATPAPIATRPRPHILRQDEPIDKNLLPIDEEGMPATIPPSPV